MAKAPWLSDKKLRNLTEAAKASYNSLEPFREWHRKSVNRLLGKNYAYTGVKEEHPVNTIRLAKATYKTFLLSDTPQTMISSDHEKLRLAAMGLQDTVNDELKLMKVLDPLDRGLDDAFHSLGIVKVALTDQSINNGDGTKTFNGKPFVEWIPAEDWVHDVSAKRWSDVAYMGHRFRIRKDRVKHYPNAIMHPGVLVKKKDQGAEGMMPELADALLAASTGQATVEQLKTYGEYVTGWYFYLPQEDLVVVIPEDGTHLVTYHKFNGPRGGPFSILSLERANGQLMPLAPTMVWNAMDKITKLAWQNLSIQAEALKHLNLYEGKASEKYKDAVEGDWLQSEGEVESKRFGNIDQLLFAFGLKTMDLAMRMEGNVEMLAGLSPSARTLGQEEILGANASQQVQHMKNAVLDWVQDVCSKIGYWYWTDPRLRKTFQYRIPETEIDVPMEFTPEMREGDYYDMNLTIEPHSLRRDTPDAKAQRLIRILMELVAPLAQAQGARLKLPRVLTSLADLTRLPELADMVEFVEGDMLETRPAGERPPAAARKTTEHVRTNATPRSMSGDNEALVGQLVSGRMGQSS